MHPNQRIVGKETAGHAEGIKPRAILPKFGPHECRVLLYMGKKYGLGAGNYYFFRHIAKGTKLNQTQVKRATRSLAQRGLVRLEALFREHDGLLAGSGYGLTRDGINAADALLSEEVRS